MSKRTIEDYVMLNIVDFRKNFDLENISKDYSKYLLTKPCQITALRFDGITILLIFHNEKIEDMDVKVFDFINAYFYSVYEIIDTEIIQQIHLQGMAESEIHEIKVAIEKAFKFSREDIYDVSFANSKNVGIISISNTLLATNRLFSESLINIFKRRTQRSESEKKIQKTVVKIKRDLEEIPASEVREKILSETVKLEQEISQLKKKFDEDIDGVRKIIGNSIDYQDFRVFSTDVSDLKKTHVPKDVFDAKVSEFKQ